MPWYRQGGRKFPWRKSSISNYRQVIAEILLQRTRAETVAAFFPNFVLAFPSWKSLDVAAVEDLQEYLRPVGLWRRRALSIKALAGEMAKRNGRFPKEREAIEALPGVGQYIANAVLLLCHDVPEPLLDVNMARVLERVYGPRKLADIRYDPYLQSLARKVVSCASARDARAVNWAVLDLAALVCKPMNPSCDNCPVRSLCRYASGLT